MGVTFEKNAVEWLLSQLSPTVIAVLFITFLTAWLTFRVNRLITTALAQEGEQTARIAILEKQQGKNIQLISSAPCISKVNGLWLADIKRNGGQPPEPVECQYLSAKRRVELP